MEKDLEEEEVILINEPEDPEKPRYRVARTLLRVKQPPSPPPEQEKTDG